MTTDDKINAVEEYLDWREETGATSTLLDGLENWRSALTAAQDERALEAVRRALREAEFDGAEAIAELKRLLGVSE